MRWIFRVSIATLAGLALALNWLAFVSFNAPVPECNAVFSCHSPLERGLEYWVWGVPLALLAILLAVIESAAWKDVGAGVLVGLLAVAGVVAVATKGAMGPAILAAGFLLYPPLSTLYSGLSVLYSRLTGTTAQAPPRAAWQRGKTAEAAARSAWHPEMDIADLQRAAGISRRAAAHWRDVFLSESRRER